VTGIAIGCFWGNDTASGLIEGNTTYGRIATGLVYENETITIKDNTIMSSSVEAI
jgi:hypothetical protein